LIRNGEIRKRGPGEINTSRYSPYFPSVATIGISDRWLKATLSATCFYYDGTNDAEKLLFAGRLMQVVLTLLTGAVIFFWIRQLAGGEAAIFGTALWVFNPIALAYGHLILTDVGATLTFLLGIWSFSRLLERPTSSRAVLVGLATGGAFLMKFTAVLLSPMYATMAMVWWWKTPPDRKQVGTVCTVIALAGLVTWITILLGYMPYWSPAPSLPAEQAARMGCRGGSNSSVFP
jgi:Gpi18-like mannosyltransferase